MDSLTFRGQSVILRYHLNWDNNNVGVRFESGKRHVVPLLFLKPYLLLLKTLDKIWRIKNGSNKS